VDQTPRRANRPNRLRRLVPSAFPFKANLQTRKAPDNGTSRSPSYTARRCQSSYITILESTPYNSHTPLVHPAEAYNARRRSPSLPHNISQSTAALRIKIQAFKTLSACYLGCSSHTAPYPVRSASSREMQERRRASACGVCPG
jgi:hypothetical protein